MALIFKHCTAGVCHFSPLLPQAAKNPCCFCYDGKMAFIYPHSLRLNHHARSEFLCFFSPRTRLVRVTLCLFFISSSSIFLNNIFDDGTLAPGSGIKKMSLFFSYSFFFLVSTHHPDTFGSSAARNLSIRLCYEYFLALACHCVSPLCLSVGPTSKLAEVQFRAVQHRE